MGNDPDYEATQAERRAKRQAAKRLALSAENQIQQSRDVKALTAENSRLRARCAHLEAALTAAADDLGSLGRILPVTNVESTFRKCGNLAREAEAKARGAAGSETPGENEPRA